MHGNQPFRTHFAQALREARSGSGRDASVHRTQAIRLALLAPVLGTEEAKNLVRSTGVSAIEMTLGLMHPGWSVEISPGSNLVFRNHVASHAKDISGRVLLYNALAELRGSIANSELYSLIVNQVLELASGPNAKTWSAHGTALEVFSLSKIISSRSIDASRLSVRLIGFGIRPKVFLSDLVCLASEDPQKDTATVRSPQFKALVDRVLPLALEPKVSADAQSIEISHDGESVERGASSRMRCLAKVLAEGVLSPSNLGSARSILYRCWYEVTKGFQPESDLGLLQSVREIAAKLPGDFNNWRLPERYLELESNPNRLLGVLSFVSKFASDRNVRHAQEMGTPTLEVFLTSPLGFSLEDAVEGVKALFELSSRDYWLCFADWRIPEIRAQVCTLGAVLRALNWSLSSEQHLSREKYAFAQHVAKVLYCKSLEGLREVGEVIARYPQILGVAETLWSKPEDFRNNEPGQIVGRFKYRRIFGVLAEHFFANSIPDLDHELGQMQDLYRRLGRDISELFLGIKTLSDVDENKVRGFVDQAEKALSFHLLSGIVQGRVGADEEIVKHYLEIYLMLDGPPYRANKLGEQNSEYVKCIQEVVRVQFAALERYFGQGALKFAFQRAVPGGSMLFENFLGACARSVAMIEGRGETYPGSGVIFSKLKLSSVFDRASLFDLGEIYPWAKGIVGDIEGTTYGLMRGLRVILPPNNNRYMIGGRSYALVSFQDHFGDRDFKGVCLVEAGAARRLISHIKQSDSFANSTELLVTIKREVNDVLWITELANFGGFSHAFERNSAPFLGHMPTTAVTNVADYLSHVHASMYSGKYSDTVTEESLVAWRPLRQAHAEVRDVAGRLFALEGIMRIAFSRYVMGFDYSTARGENIFPHPDLLISGEEAVPMFAERMLEFSLQYARTLRGAGVRDMNKYPVLVLANPLDYWSQPDDSTFVDLFDLTACGDFGEHRLSTGTLTDADIAVWRERFWKPANAKGFEIRLEDRRRVFV